ncbi:hypothetical protein BGZ98_008233 [Dissophora globulifera]|nr:hypothetical protein BGZ98_008233 [Dissophora globulifera]
MLSTTQAFKFGSIERKLDLISPNDAHENQFIYVDDVLQAFQILGSSNAVKFEADGVSISYVRDDNGTMYDPKRISCRKGVIEILDQTAMPGSTSLTSTIALEHSTESVDLLSIRGKVSRHTDPSEPLHLGPSKNLIMHVLEDINIATEASHAEHYAGIVTHVIANAKTENRVMDELKEIRKDVMEARKDLMEARKDIVEIRKDSKEALEMAKRMYDRLILIQSKVGAVLTQNYELLEFTIPRLFIVLPETLTSWDPTTMLRTKFRLHFICECGEHTKPAKGAKTPASEILHELHLAKHEGYVVRNPTELFKKYGPFLMLMLEIIKQGACLIGSVVPGVSPINSITSQGIDYSLKYLAELRAQIKRSDGVDIDSNLYRMTTKDGHLKWVCRDHYQAGYQEELTQKLRDVVKLARGEFDEQLGRITTTLKSGYAATEFYKALCKGDGVLELILNLSWECERSDLEELRDALKRSRVSILRINIQQLRTSFSSKNIVKLPNFESKRLSHRCKFTFEMITRHIEEKELGILAETSKTNSTLAVLDLGGCLIGNDGALALSKALKINSTLTTLNLQHNAIRDSGAQAVSEALKMNSNLTTLNLWGNSIRDNGAQALS